MYIRLEVRKQKVELQSKVLQEYLKVVNDDSKNEIRKRLVTFEKFVIKKYGVLDRNFILRRLEGDSLKVEDDKTKIDVYVLLTKYAQSIVKNNKNISKATVDTLLYAARAMLNYVLKS